MIPIQRKILLTPGPATTTDTVKYAQVVPDICPREKSFTDLMRSISRDLVQVVNGGEDYTAVIFSGSGTAIMDAVINSAVPPTRSLAVIINGAYGDRMAEIGRTYGIDVVEVRYDYGQRIDLEQVAITLAAQPKIGALAWVHHETTTGILNPMKETSELARRYNAVSIVDAVSSYAGIPIDIQKIKIDHLFSTSNKNIQGMPGLAFSISRITELLKLEHSPRRSYYLSLYHQYCFFRDKGEMQFTPPVQTAYALRQALDEFFQEGGEARYQRYTECWKTLRTGLNELGFRFLLDEADESHLITTVLYPDNPRFSFQRLHDAMNKAGFTIYPGKIGHKNTFRIANIGAIYPVDIFAFLEQFKDFLSREMP